MTRLVNGTRGTPVRVGVVGNFSCANRGDCAILRGLLTALPSQNVEYTVYSEHPEQGSKLLGVPLKQSLFTGLRLQSRMQRYKAELLIDRPKVGIIPYYFSKFRRDIEELRSHDVLVFAGGSYFVDLYPRDKYLLPAIAKALGIPFNLLGHSLGPFEKQGVSRWASKTLPHATSVTLRDRPSREHALGIGISELQLREAPDTAWITTDATRLESDANRAETQSRTVGVSVRELGPFGARLGISDAQMTSWVVDVLDDLVARGYRLVGLSTCTGFEGYHYNDTLKLMDIRALLKVPGAMEVVTDEWNDIAISDFYQTCDVVFSMRMHATILSMRSGTPAFVIPYEHKSVGLFNEIGCPDRVVLPGELSPKVVAERISQVAKDKSERDATMKLAIELREQAVSGVENAFAELIESL